MTLSTYIRVLSKHDHQEVFGIVRDILGIPNDHPYSVSDVLGGESLFSNPGGLEAMVIVGGKGSLSTDELEWDSGSSEWNVLVNLDTAYSYSGKHGSASGVHNYVIQQLMKRIPSIDFWANNEFEETWHHNALPYS